MGIITFKKFIYTTCVLATFFLGVATVNAQCPTVTSPNQSFCDVESPTVASLVATNNGNGIRWYNSPTSTTPLAGTVGLVTGAIYYADDASGTCGTRQSVRVTIYSAPVGQNFQGVCVDVSSAATISDLIAVGNNVQWYITPTGGTPLSGGTQLFDDTIYYASQTNPNTGCETSRLSVFVNVGVVPVPTGAPTQSFCDNPSDIPTVGDLDASGNNRWYLTNSSASPLPFSTPLINGQRYFATSIDPPCESINRFEVTAVLIPLNNSGINGTLQICQNQLTTTPPVNLFGLLGGTPDNTGTWTGPFATSNGNLGTLDLSALTLAGSPYVFTYTVTSALCPTSTSTVTVRVLPLPVASIAAGVTICSGSTATVNFSGTANATITYNVNSGPNQTITLNASGTASITQVYNATTTYTLVSVASSGTPSCSQTQTGSAVITVLPLPIVALSSNVSICIGGSATVTFIGTPNATVIYKINNGANQTIVLDNLGNASITGTFNATTTYTLVSVSSATTPICTQLLSDSIVINVIPLPTATISSNVSICPNSAATISFTGTPNATITFTANGVQQTILLNGTGTASLTQNFAVTTTFELVTAATLGTPNCVQPLTGSVVVTVLPLPIVSITSNTSICFGDSATVTFTGTANATVTYTVNNGPNQTILLNNSGTAIITQIYNTTTTFDLVSIASGGIPSCNQSVTGQVVITILPLPTVVISSNITICPNDQATVTFTGTPNATVTYTVNSGANQTILLDAAGNASIIQVYSVTTTYSLVSIATAGTPGCIKPQNGTITVTVLPLPIASIATSTTICSGDSATVTFTGTSNATVIYTVDTNPAQTIVLNASGTATITQTYTATTTYNLIRVTSPDAPFCTQLLSGSVIITVLPLPTVTISSDITVCSGESATVTFTGTPNSVITYNINSGSNQTITLNGVGIATISQTYTATTIYNLISAATSGSPGCNQLQNGVVTVTVLPLPTVAIASDVTICSGGSATVNFIGTPNASVVYTVNGGAEQTIVLDAAGVGAVSGTYTTTTVFTLVRITSAGLPSCVRPISGTVTITIKELPIVAITGTTSICVNDSATVTFTGTPNSSVIYTVNNGPQQTIVLNNLGIATITGNFAVTTVYTLVSSTTQGLPSCTQPQTGTVTITVVPLPTVAIASDITICSGASATITFTGTPNATVSYTANGVLLTITLNATGSATITETYSATTIYSLVSANALGCSQPQSGSATVTVLPLPIVSISSSVSICPGGNATVTFTGTPNGVVVYTVNSGPNATITLSAAGTATISATYTATTTFNLVSITLTGIGGCTQNQTGTVIITVIPLPIVAISAENTTVCAQSNGTVIFTGTPNAIVTYTVNNGPNQTITLNASGTIALSGTIGITTTYNLVSVATGSAPICSQPQAGSVTITAIAQPIAGNDVANFSICANGAPIDLFTLLGPNAQPGGAWLPALSSGTGIFNPATDLATTYIYTVTGISPCPNDTASVTVTIVPPPNAGVDTTLTICSNEDAQDLFILLGPTAQSGGIWSPALTSGSGLFDPSVDTAGTYTYTVIPADNICGSDSATIAITIIQGPNAGQDGALTLCMNSLQQNLFNYLNGNPQVGGTWSPALASGTGVFNPAVDPAGIYTYTFIGNQPCDNDTAIVTVTVNPIPNAGGDGSVTFCTNFAAADLFLNLAGSPQTGGTWSPNLASGTGVFNPLVDAAGIYTYTVGGNLCAIDSATVTVTVIQAPNAGGPGTTITTCISSTSIDLTTGLNGTQASGTWADDDATGALTNNIFNPSAVLPGTYHFTYTVTGGISPCQFDTATVTVVVDPTPNAGTFLPFPSVCSSFGTINLFTLLTGNQLGGVWTTSNNIVVSNEINIAAFGAGIYSYTYTVTNSCGRDTQTVQFTVLPSPILTIPNITIVTPICIGQPAIVNLSGLVDGIYTIAYSLGGSNILANQTATVTITAGTGNFTIAAIGIPNIGTTTITFASITNTVNNCQTVLSNILVNFVVRPLANVDNVNLSIANVCLGNNVIVAINNATGLADGSYQFTYSIPGASVLVGVTSVFQVVNGAGSFEIPGTAFSNAGPYTITITGILSLSGGCGNQVEDATANFVILPLINLSDAIVTAPDVCLGELNTVSITGASGITNGTYNIIYQLSGASSGSGNSTLIILEGAGSFVIPASSLPTIGAVTVTIQFPATANSCGVGIGLDQVTFNVVQLGVPEIISGGNEFCQSDNPTIADLSANIANGQTVNWYATPTGGTPLNLSDNLRHNTVYYAALLLGTCEGTTRLAITVSIINCNEIIIPDGFSPNGDNINDTFDIVDIREIYPNFKIEFYNRYGNILYKGNANTPNWDGTSNKGGIQLGSGVAPVGVYFYILEFNDGNRKPVQGRIYLSR